MEEKDNHQQLILQILQFFFLLANKKLERDWTALPPELLEMIADKLTVINDLVSFRLVFRTVHTPSILTNLPSHLPWYFGPSNRHLFSPSNNRIYRFRPPHQYYFGCTQIYGSSFGYLLFTNNTQSLISLINPFTRSHIRLPGLPNRSRDGRSTNTVQRGKLIKSDSSNGFSVVLCCGDWNNPDLFSYRLGDIAWDVAWKQVPYTGVSGDFAYHRGCFVYMQESSDTTYVIDPNRQHYKRRIPPSRINYRYPSWKYLVASSSGRLLKVTCLYKEGRRNMSEKRVETFEVFQLDESKEWEWVKMRSIGDDVLFVDYCNAMCLAASDFGGRRGNCIYFWEMNNVSVFDIGNRSIQRLSYNLHNFPQGARGGAWFMPSL